MKLRSYESIKQLPLSIHGRNAQRKKRANGKGPMSKAEKRSSEKKVPMSKSGKGSFKKHYFVGFQTPVCLLLSLTDNVLLFLLSS